MSNTSVSIVIPTFNGKELLEKFLPSVIKAAQFYNGTSEIIIVDDFSSDGSEDFLKNSYPQIRLIKLKKNVGFALASNEGIRQSNNRIVILLNNDVLIEKDFFGYLVNHFKDREVFAVRPGLKTEISETSADLVSPHIQGSFKYGLVYPNLSLVSKSSGLAFVAGGGACAFDKDKFLELDGFDELFSPLYYEDVDISFRAWKRGWKIIYEPLSLAYHESSSTVKRFHRRGYVNMICERNRYLLVWKNITDPGFIFQHFVFIPFRILGYILEGKFASLQGFFCALGKAREVLKKRRIEKQFKRRSDREIFNLFSEKLQRAKVRKPRPSGSELKSVESSVDKAESQTSPEAGSFRKNTINYPSISIVITTFNGQNLLQGLLPLVESAAKRYPGENEIIVVDDAGSDGSDEFVKNTFPGIKLVRLRRNFGPLKACNHGFALCKNKIIILLDNDVIVAEDFISHLIPHFNDSNVFAVRPSYLINPSQKNSQTSYSHLLGKFKYGLIYTNEVTMAIGRLNSAFIAGGGGSAFDREKLKELGNFDVLFSPFYYEDADISYRAWKRGWKIIFEPSSLVFHESNGTINRFHRSSFVTMICERNRFFLVWKNITDWQMMAVHIIFIPVRLVAYLIKGKFASCAGFFCALLQIKKVIRKRRSEKTFFKVGDREIFNNFKQ